MHKFIIAILALALAGCAGAVPWNDQNDAGITKVHVQTVAITDANGKVIAVAPSDVQWIDGKERANITMIASLKDGTISYSASNVLAFDGQRARQAVETAVSADVKAVAPGITDSIMNALIKAFVPVTAVVP